jgi:hypothetical protein
MVTTSFLVGSGMGPETACAVALGGLHDLFRARVDELMIVSLEADADHFLICHLLFPP